MLPPLDDLALKKRTLRLRSAMLRQTFADQIGQGVAPALDMADRVIVGGQWLRRHPVWLVVPAVALLVLRPRFLAGGLAGSLAPTVLRWAGRGLWAWQTWTRLRPLIHTARHKLEADPEGDG